MPLQPKIGMEFDTSLNAGWPPQLVLLCPFLLRRQCRHLLLHAEFSSDRWIRSHESVHRSGPGVAGAIGRGIHVRLGPGKQEDAVHQGVAGVRSQYDGLHLAGGSCASGTQRGQSVQAFRP